MRACLGALARLAAVLLIFWLAGCTVERIFYPICELTTIDLLTGEVRQERLDSIPDWCAEEFRQRRLRR